MTSSQHGPYVQGCTHATLRATEGCDPARGSESQKGAPGSDWGLQLDPMKAESLVIADQHAAVNTFPGLVHTARHITKVGCARSGRADPSGRQVATAWSMIGVKS